LSLRNTVEFAQVALCLVPEILDSVDVIMGIREEFGVVDPKMLEVRNIQHIVGLPAVRIDNAVRDHFALNNRN
jgi:hypothetical protein